MEVGAATDVETVDGEAEVAITASSSSEDVGHRERCDGAGFPHDNFGFISCA